MGKDPIEAGADVLERHFGEKGANVREFYRGIVRDIYAGLEPTPEMIEAGVREYATMIEMDTFDERVTGVFMAMLCRASSIHS